MTVRILQEDNEGNRVVELSSELESGWCSSQAQFGQLVVVLDDDTAGLYRYSGTEVQQFALSFEEVDRLVEAYQAHKQAQAARLAEYEKQQAALLAEYEKQYSRPSSSLDDLPF
jgi:hypothetical protein